MKQLFQWHLFLLFLLISSMLFAETGYTLCIDGGGSKTALQVLDREGRRVPLVKNGIAVETLETTGANINSIGKEGVRAVLRTLFEDVQLCSIHLADVLAHCDLVAGMAGVGIAKNKQEVTSCFEEWGLDRDRMLIMTDAELALQLIDDQGIILIAGTGAICLGKKDGTLFRVGGLGRILGDEGSGYQIGRQALKAALAEEYGWGIPTSITPALKAFFNVAELKSLIPSVNLGEMPASKIASCAPLVFSKAWEGDAVAEEIVNQSIRDLGQLLATQMQLSQLSSCDLHLWGGLFKSSYADDFIQKIVDHAVHLVNGDSHQECFLKITNQSHQNVAALYVMVHIRTRKGGVNLSTLNDLSFSGTPHCLHTRERGGNRRDDKDDGDATAAIKSPVTLPLKV